MTRDTLNARRCGELLATVVLDELPGRRECRGT